VASGGDEGVAPPRDDGTRGIGLECGAGKAGAAVKPPRDAVEVSPVDGERVCVADVDVDVDVAAALPPLPPCAADVVRGGRGIGELLKVLVDVDDVDDVVDVVDVVDDVVDVDGTLGGAPARWARFSAAATSCSGVSGEPDNKMVRW